MLVLTRVLSATLLTAWLGLVLALTAQAQSAATRFAAGSASRIKVTPNEAAQRVDIEIDGKPFTSYTWAAPLKKPVLYPIYSPKGNFITRGWPLAPRAGERVDHPHHVGLWLNYGNVNGVDFWNNSDQISPEHKGPFGTVRHKAIKKAQGGKNVGQLEVEAEWVGPKGEVLLVENTLYEFSGMGSDRQITRTTTLKATNGPIAFPDNKEGLIGLRVASELELPSKEPIVLTTADGKAGKASSINRAATGDYVNSESIKGDSVWGKRGEWLLLNGTLNNKAGTEPISVVLLDFPKNIGHPTYWHARGYGLFAANPLGQAVFSNGQEELGARLTKGASMQLKHRLRIQSGRQLDEPSCERLYTAFTMPEQDE